LLVDSLHNSGHFCNQGYALYEVLEQYGIHVDLSTNLASHFTYVRASTNHFLPRDAAMLARSWES